MGRSKRFAGASRHVLWHKDHRAGVSRIDPEEERDPPPDPTPAVFPVHDAYSSVVWSSSSPPPILQPLFARITRPADISLQHVVALNVRIEPACSPGNLIPPMPNGIPYFTHVPPDQPTAATYASAAKVDASLAKKWKDFADRLAEVRVDNDTAFRIITKTPRPGRPPPRLAHMRKFWEAMENMSQYWDTSLDQYYEAMPEVVESAQNPKRQRLDSGTEHNTTSLPSTLEKHHPFPGRADNTATDNEPRSPIEASPTDPQETRTVRSTSATPEPQLRRRYKGRRTGTGRQMPEQFRVDAVRAFVEGAIWPFQATLAAPRHMPVVQVGQLNLPTRQTSAVYRVPQDRAKARQGFVQGPILSLQVRADTDFSAEGVCDNAARLDLMRELGGLLQIAQERCREGKVEVKPGEGKWWTTKPRWGGGSGGEVEGQGGNSDVLQTAEDSVGGTSPSVRGSSSSSNMLMSRPRKKKTPVMLWKELKCGTGFWDSRTEYQAIGKAAASPYDEIFMVSSLNHHISIVKMTVHTAYMEYLLTAQLPEPAPEEEDWGSPRLQRTSWFDLFDVEQRVQAFEALWAVITYMTREPQVSPTAELTDLSVNRK